MLITALRIAIQDPRINKIVDQEVRQLMDKNHSLALHGVGSASLSYIEAVILESLRLSPPAPVIPEIVTETFSLDNEESLNFPFHYDTVFQRNGGQGKLLITPKREKEQNALA